RGSVVGPHWLRWGAESASRFLATLRLSIGVSERSGFGGACARGGLGQEFLKVSVRRFAKARRTKPAPREYEHHHLKKWPIETLRFLSGFSQAAQERVRASSPP